MKCEYGFCTHCSKPIMDSCPTCNTKRPNGQYTEVEMNLSNGSRMKVGVCLECRDKVFQANRKELMAAIRNGWSAEQDKMNWPKEKRDAYWKTFGEEVLEIVD